ncbi:hypothetical protein LCD48_22555 [Enterobacter asburiae]|nr:hypothetical protein LCD48_22555 [Enterobacter asburiae]
MISYQELVRTFLKRWPLLAEFAHQQ